MLTQKSIVSTFDSMRALGARNYGIIEHAVWAKRQKEYEREDETMNVKEQITKAVEKISGDKKLQEQFKTEPVKALESVLGVDLPDEVIEQVIDGVKAKLTVDKASDVFDSIKGFLKK